MLRSKVTLTDIARESGVSAATVSLALRNKTGLREETRQRVLDVAQQLGYLHQPSNRAASRLGVQSIGVIVKARNNDPAATNSFYGPVLAGVEAVCRRHQIDLVYANLLVDEENVPVEPPRLLMEQHTDGLLVVGMQLDRTMQHLLQRDASPVVLVDAYAENHPFDAVLTDNCAGASCATRYLIEQGHRHIAILGSLPHAFPSVVERRKGFLQALSAHDLPPYFWDCPLWPDAAYTAVPAYLEQHPQVTAVFACNDAVAIALMKVAQEQPRLVPQTLSIVGFDNIEPAQHISPPLTTMHVDKVGMGRMAAQLLINRIEHPTAALVRTLIRPQLVPRKSVVPNQLLSPTVVLSESASAFS